MFFRPLTLSGRFRFLCTNFGDGIGRGFSSLSYERCHARLWCRVTLGCDFVVPSSKPGNLLFSALPALEVRLTSICEICACISDSFHSLLPSFWHGALAFHQWVKVPCLNTGEKKIGEKKTFFLLIFKFLFHIAYFAVSCSQPQKVYAIANVYNFC